MSSGWICRPNPNLLPGCLGFQTFPAVKSTLALHFPASLTHRSLHTLLLYTFQAFPQPQPPVFVWPPLSTSLSLLPIRPLWNTGHSDARLLGSVPPPSFPTFKSRFKFHLFRMTYSSFFIHSFFFLLLLYSFVKIKKNETLLLWCP